MRTRSILGGLMLVASSVFAAGCGSGSTTPQAPVSTGANTGSNAGPSSSAEGPATTDKELAESKPAAGVETRTPEAPRDDAEATAALKKAGARLQSGPTGNIVAAVLVDPTDETLGRLTALPELRSLKLERGETAEPGAGISEAGWKRLGDAPVLVELSLAGFSIGDPEVGQLALAVDLEGLDLSWTRITDAALASLSRMASLKSLDVSYTGVSDRGIEQLATLPNLRHLAADGSDVTDAGREKLGQAIPELAFQSVPPLAASMLVSGSSAVAERPPGELAPGHRAPEIEGEDIDGVRFKLSDYRGRVVMLDFWGHW